jgi:hypothetical protein
MCRELGCLSLAGFVILSAIGAIPVDASIRPSFRLDHCSWNATHIVLVQTTLKDGVFSVVESWKGDLKPVDSVEVPELKPNKDAVPISSYPKPRGFVSEDTLTPKSPKSILARRDSTGKRCRTYRDVGQLRGICARLRVVPSA